MDEKEKAVTNNDDIQNLRSIVLGENKPLGKEAHFTAEWRSAFSGFIRRNCQLRVLQEIIEELPIGDTYSHAFSKLVDKYITEDVDSAIPWLLSNEDKPENQAAFSRFGRVIGSTDIEKGKELGLQIQDRALRQKYLTQFLVGFTESDPSGAKNWVEQNGQAFLSEDIAKSDLSRELSAVGAYSDALEVAVEIGDTNSSQNALKQLGRRWAEADPQGALAVINTGDSSPAIDSLATAFGSELGKGDPRRGSELLSQLDNSSARDSVIVGFVGSIAQLQPVEAITWAASIGSDEVRLREINNLLDKSLIGKNELLLKIQELPISEIEKATILERYQNN